MLTITGAIAETNAPGKAEFDQAMLDALGADEVKTARSGPRARRPGRASGSARCSTSVGATGTTVVATALNDYSGEIGIDLIEDYPVLLATRLNGEPLAADKGPIWIIYPIDDYPGAPRAGRPALGWQLATVDVRLGRRSRLPRRMT